MKAIFAIIAVFAFAFPTLVSADGIRADECPVGKFLFVEQPIAGIGDYKYLTAEVLVRGQGLATEKYLSKRSDDWIHLSSERSMIPPLSLVENCLPEGEYQVRIEYYTRVRLIGDWFLGSIEYQITLNRPIYSTESQALAGTWYKATFKDQFTRYWPLFAAYSLILIFFIFAPIIFLSRLMKNR